MVKSVQLVLLDEGGVELVSDSFARRPEIESECREVDVVEECDEPVNLRK